jgi:hypothetical protein
MLMRLLRRIFIASLLLIVTCYIVLTLDIKMNEFAARKEGERIVNWIEKSKHATGSLPLDLQACKSYRWSYLVSGDAYVLTCYYSSYARSRWQYTSTDAIWYLDRDG